MFGDVWMHRIRDISICMQKTDKKPFQKFAHDRRWAHRDGGSHVECNVWNIQNFGKIELLN